jgi:type IV fimbrial biogenesis protein FimT
VLCAQARRGRLENRLFEPVFFRLFFALCCLDLLSIPPVSLVFVGRVATVSGGSLTLLCDVSHPAECRDVANLRKVISTERNERGAPVNRMEKVGVSSRKPGAAGFGLLESMVVLAILAAGAVCAAPALASWRARDRVEAVSRGWLALLQHGRDQAVRTGLQVTLCQGRLHTGGSQQDGECADVGLQCDEGRMAGTGDWSCAQMVSTDSEGRAAAPLTQFFFDANVMVIGDTKPLRFMPPTGRIAGGPRHFEIGLRGSARGTAKGTTAEVATRGVTRDVARDVTRDVAASEAGPGVAHELANESAHPVERRCVLVAGSGRVRMQPGGCGRA